MKTILSSAVILILAASPAAAADKNSDEPIDITSDHAEYDKDGNTVLYTGNVIVIQGTNRLKSDWLKAYLRSQQDKARPPQSEANSSAAASPAASIYKIDAKGSVFLSSPEETASGSTGTYDVPNKEITLRGDVVLTRSNNVMRGAVLVVNTETGYSTLDPGQAARVKGRFMPETKAENKAQADKSGAAK
jgi:lipopolysaccharide export system protein LptA